jgi:hypothetical protein
MELTCPRCGKDFIQRAQREGLLDQILSAVYVYPFRCQLCTHRFRLVQAGKRYQKEGADKRQYQRFATQVPVTFSGEQISGEGVTKDLSMGGCGLETETKVPTGILLQLRIHILEMEPPVKVEAATVRMARANTLGIEFLRLSSQERNRLAQFISELLLVARR